MLRQYVGALINQHFGGITFLARIKPGAYPHNLDCGLGIDTAQTQSKRVNSSHDFRNWE